MTSPPDDTTTDLHAVITTLRAERDAGLAREATLSEELAARTAELLERQSRFDERIEYEAATVGVLKAISSSPSDTLPVFNLITRRAAELCESSTALYELREGQLHYMAGHGMDLETLAAFRQSFPRPLDRSLVAGRAILERRIMHVQNVAADTALSQEVRDLGGTAIVGIPLLRDGEPIGAVALNGRQPGGFSESQIALLQTFAEQAVIAISSAETYRALQERTEALATRNSEYGERIEQQAATIDVLKVMSSSPGNAQPVFDLIVERARAFCGADQCTVALLDGDMLHLKAKAGMSEASARNYAAQFPRPVNTASMFGRAILAREAVQTPDVSADPEHFSRTRVGGPEFRAIVAVPMLRAGTPIGAIALGRRMPGVYSASQMGLLQTFAEQAVIAITSAETYRALQTRTSDLQETLEYQTATSDLLKVISRSTFDLHPVLATVAETAAKLCLADHAMIIRREGDRFRLTVNFGFPPEYEAHFHKVVTFPFSPGAPEAVHRAVAERRAVHIHDVAAVPGYADVSIRLGKQRTSLGVPLLREGEPIGVIILARQRVEPFTDRQIELVSTFADQAVIAIENSRLITEQQEALEQQTATAEVLQVINASPGNLAPVFDAILAKAMHLCDAAFGMFNAYDGRSFRTVVTRGVPAAFAAFRAEHPPTPSPGSPFGRAFETKRPVHIFDWLEEPVYKEGTPGGRAIADLGAARTVLNVPLVKDTAVLGMISFYRQQVRPFSDKQIALLENFAAQAVIAMENARLLTEQREALEQQTATAEVLQVINASPANLAPVFEAMLDKALGLCNAAFGVLWTYDGTRGHAVALRGVPPAFVEYLTRAPHPVDPGGALDRLLSGEPMIHIADVAEEQAYRTGNPLRRALVELGRARTLLAVPLRKNNVYLGHFVIYRREVRPFSDKQIALLQNFAAQAVIAMENARLLTEQQEALEQQTATAEVLQVINASPGNLAPVFDAILEKAHTLCGAGVGALFTYDGTHFRAVATRGFPEQHARVIRKPFPPTPHHQPLVGGERYVHFPDVRAIARHQNDEVGFFEQLQKHPVVRSTAERTDMRTGLGVPLRKDGTLLGYISAFRQEVRLFSEKEIALLENFAAQAVIAMENARLLDEIRQRQEELRVTFENMGDGVAKFDETQHLVAWNRKFQDILDVPDDIIARRQTFSEYVQYLADRGEYGAGPGVEEHVRHLTEQVGQYRTYERTRPDGRVIEIRHNPVPSGGFVLIFSDITERKRNEAEIHAARDAAEEASRTIEAAYRDLKAAQANLIQAEKMASLGQLTAGIAHEIKNPLNFVNNFAELSVDLLGELKDAIAPAEPALTEKQRAEVEDVSAMLTSNLEKITEHGKRADGIVKAMLEHSRGSSGERRMVDLNTLIDEALNLAYHGARAQDQSFNITLERDFGEGIAPIEVNPQDITRVFLNIFSNGFYAATRRARNGGDAGLVPTLKVMTRDAGEAVEIRVWDNGIGIPAEISDKLFQPFFTTKPTGEGTGLGLSITYDIVTKQHGGTITVDSEVGEYSEFTIRLPRNP